MPTSATPTTLNLLALLLTALSVLAFAWDWLALGLVFLLVATPLDGIAARLGALRMQEGDADSWWSHLLPAAAAAALVALGFALADSRGWGCIVLAAATVASVAALRTELRGRKLPGRIWLAERKGMSWLLLPFALFGLWGTGLGVLAGYAAGSFFWAQRQVHRPPPGLSPD